VVDVNVLGTCVGNGVTCQGDATLIVSMDDGCIDLQVSEVLK